MDGPQRLPCYGSDTTETQWQVVRASLSIPAWLEGRGGRPESYCHRVMLDTVRHVVDNGVKWANLPTGLPTVSAHARLRPPPAGEGSACGAARPAA
ncbi:transposase [Streptomyces spinoverrucosus]|uniref:transposase n=1 Tax=Streptomyces spinoverrucosus TaxID=284043 RepID=UPI0035AE3FDD